MAVEEPRSRVVSLEADYPSSTLDADDVATRRVVVRWAAVALDNFEGMSVETIHREFIRTKVRRIERGNTYWNGWTWPLAEPWR